MNFVAVEMGIFSDKLSYANLNFFPLFVENILFRFMGKIEMQKNDTSIEKLYFLLLM
jgi:hypothetical protein